MLDKTQKRWSFIVNILYFGIFIAAFFLFMKYAFGILLPFIAAFAIAAFLQKPLKFITGKSKKIPYGATSAVLAVLVYGVFIGVIALGGAKIVSSLGDLISYLLQDVPLSVIFLKCLNQAILNLKFQKCFRQRRTMQLQEQLILLVILL